MRKLYCISTLVALCLAAIPTQAQDYNPLIRPNTYWDVMEPNPSPFFYPCPYLSGERYFFEGDTIIEEIEYQILHQNLMVSTNPNGYFCPPYAVNGNYSYIRTFMRENIEKQQVFMHGSIYSSNEEMLLYDFSLQTGDTLFFFANSDDPDLSELYAIVDETETIELANGEKRKSMSLYASDFGGHYTHIEGVGNNLGLAFTEYFLLLTIYPELTCVSENGIQLYGMNQCFNFLDIDEIFSSNNHIRLYPNPIKSDGTFTLICNEQLKELAIYDLKGTIVQTIETTNSQQTHRITLDAGTNSGIYILKIQTKKNQIYHEKIVLY